MKKLNLKNLKLNSNDLLQREQLKTVFGGYGFCGQFCSYDSECPSECSKCTNGRCNYNGDPGDCLTPTNCFSSADCANIWCNTCLPPEESGGPRFCAT